ncbi:MAG TPA: tetratricopeptide repeat protein [Fimbriimonadaceae bacterium]|nr:tetratricopeptide repeat protein [Fimbriimonadaceae bacterium]
MAALGDKGRAAVCDKCFATVASDATYCPECGASIGGDATAAEGSDAAIYPELARANLLRMRGEYRQAEEVCLGLLKRFPNNSTANSLLGDICAERGDLEHAVQWYELALDLVPDSPPVKDKLAAVRNRIREREAASTAEQIGLPPPRANHSALYVALALIGLIVVGVGAFVLGQGSQEPAVHAPVEVGRAESGPPLSGREPPQGSSEEPPAPVRAEVASGWRDAALMDLLTRSLADGAALLDAWQDPRTQAVLVSFRADSDDPRAMAARLGSSVLEQLPAAQVVTLRAVKDHQLLLVADVTRQAVMQTATQEWQAAHAGDPNAWTAAVLSNMWAPGALPQTQSPPGS